MNWRGTLKIEIKTDKPLNIEDQLEADFSLGKLFWKVRKRGPGAAIGKEAGTLRDNGYYQVHIDGKFYRRSHIIWYLYCGYLPPQEIDHINRDPSDDRIENLRLSSSSMNKANQKKRSDNKSGHRGVHFRQDRNKWVAQIAYDSKRVTLGTYDSIDEAITAYQEASLKYHREYSTVCL